MSSISRRTGLKFALSALASLPLVLAGTRAAQAATHQVTIAGFAFSPARLDVAVGDTVVFTNSDGAPHTATALDGSFDTGTIKRNKTGEIVITAAGVANYKCNFHPSMKGSITAA